MAQQTLQLRPNTAVTLSYTPPANQRIARLRLADNNLLSSINLVASVAVDGSSAKVSVPSGVASVGAPQAVTPDLASIAAATTTIKQLQAAAQGGPADLGSWVAHSGSGATQQFNQTLGRYELKGGASEQARVYYNGGGVDGVVSVAGQSASTGGLRIILRHPNASTGGCVVVRFVPDAEKTTVTVHDSSDGFTLGSAIQTGYHPSVAGQPYAYEAWIVGTTVKVRVNNQLVIATATIVGSYAGTSHGVCSNSTTTSTFDKVGAAGFAGSNSGSPAVVGSPAIGGTVVLNVTPASNQRLGDMGWTGTRASDTSYASTPLGEGENILGYMLESRRSVVVEDSSGTWATTGL